MIQSNDRNELTLYLFSETFLSCTEDLLRFLVLLKMNLATFDRYEGNNFGYLARVVFRNLDREVPYPLLAGPDIIDFARSRNYDCNDFIDSPGATRNNSTKPKEAKKSKLSSEAIKLLYEEIPSKDLPFWDEDYGKRKIIKLSLNPNRIVPGSITVEQYMALMEKQASNVLQNRGLGSKQMKTFRKA